MGGSVSRNSFDERIVKAVQIIGRSLNGVLHSKVKVLHGAWVLTFEGVLL